MANSLAAALELAARGFAVFPVRKNEKRPACLHGAKDATTNPDDIKNLFNDEYNIGIEASRSGLVLIDFDLKDGRDGKAAMDALIAKYGKPTATLAVRTPSQGLHLYYRAPAGPRLPNIKDHPIIGVGVEVKADNQYLVAPPSRIGENQYTWINPSQEIADCPSWLAELCRKTLEKPTPIKSDFEYSAKDVVDRFNSQNSIEATLGGYGYFAGGQPGFLRHPNNDSQDSVHLVADNMSYHFGAGDPLRGKGCGKDSCCFLPFGIVTELQFGGDFKAAVRSMAREMGMDGRRHETQPVAVPAATIKATVELPAFINQGDIKNTEFLWKYRIPLGCLTSLAGEQGVGKSTWLYDIIARLSIGARFPDGEPSAKCKTLMLSFEDNPADSAGPKLVAAGADLTMIKKWPGIFTIKDLAVLEQYLARDPAIKLVVIEPIYEVGMEKINDTKAVADALGAIQKTAEKFNIAAIGVNHFKKGKAETSNDKTINSMAFTSKPRACWGIVNKKDDPTIKILALGKHNIRANKMALQFRIENHDLHENGQTIETCKVVYLDEQLDTDLDTLIKEAFDHRKTTKEAEPWLAELLDNGDVDSEQVYTAGKDAGFSWRQIRDAKDKLKVRARKHGIGKDSKWKWHLDKHEVPAEPANLTEDELNDDPF